MWQSLPKPCDERSAGGAACRPQGVAFAVDAVALVILFFDPAGDFLEKMAAHWPAVKQRWLYVALVGALRPAGFTSLFSLGASRMICFWSALTSYLGHVEVSLRQTAAAANNSGQACSMIVSAAFYKLSA